MGKRKGRSVSCSPVTVNTEATSFTTTSTLVLALCCSDLTWPTSTCLHEAALSGGVVKLGTQG